MTNTPLIELKTIEDLLLHLTAAGWRKTPTKEPTRTVDRSHLGEPEALITEGTKPVDPPCWETSSDRTSAHHQTDNKWIYLHPGMGEDHGDVYVQAVVKDGHLDRWLACESYTGASVDLDPANTTIEQLKQRLSDWIEGWANEAPKARKPLGYWQNPDNIEKEARLFIEEHGVENFSNHKMRRLGFGSFNAAIGKYGGFAHWRKRLNLPHVARTRREINTLDDVAKWIAVYIATHGAGQFTSGKVNKLNPTLYRAIQRHGGFDKIRRLLRIRKPKRGES